MNVKASTKYKREHKADYGKERIEILYEDEFLCVINKPTGMLTCPYPGSRARTAQDVLEQLMRKRGVLNKNHKPLVVHRLDRDTSGVMMFAFTENAQSLIMKRWHTMVTSRLYRAVAENPKSREKVLPDTGLIDDELSFNAYNVGFVPSEKMKQSDRNLKTVPARTHFSVVERGPTHTLFELSLDTGKKNQIRAHLASRDYPLCGDENYRARTDHFHRLCLHARTLSFVHPFTQKEMSFCVPEPGEWLEYVKGGDLNPEPPVWAIENEEIRGRKLSAKNGVGMEGVILGQKRISSKEKAHMNFIELGKKRR